MSEPKRRRRPNNEQQFPIDPAPASSIEFSSPQPDTPTKRPNISSCQISAINHTRENMVKNKKASRSKSQSLTIAMRIMIILLASCGILSVYFISGLIVKIMSKEITFGDFKASIQNDNTLKIIDYMGENNVNQIVRIISNVGERKVTSIGEIACRKLSDSNVRSIIIPDSITSIEGSFWRYDNHPSIDVSTDNPVFTVIDGVLFSKTDKRLVYYS